MKRRKWLGLLLTAVMVLTMIPVTAFAVDSDEPTASGTYFFANGIPINIIEEEPTDATDVSASYSAFTAKGNDAYISWTIDGITSYIGVSASVSVYGGSDGSSSAVTVDSTSITMTGGTVHNIFGGNLGMTDSVAEHTSVVTGDTRISISGADSIVANLLHGGGQYNSAVQGTAYITVNDADLTQGEYGGCYINGGTHGNGNEGSRDIENGTMNTSAIVNNAVIEINNSKALLVGGGGSGSTKTMNASVTINDSIVDNVFASGINGEVVNCSVNINGSSEIDAVSGTNRGFVGTAVVNLNGGHVGSINTGASPGCMTSDSGSPDGSGITESIEWNIAEGVSVDQAQLTPLIKKDASGIPTCDLGGITVNNSGDDINFEMSEFVYVVGAGSATEASVNDFRITPEKTLAFTGVTVTIPAESVLTNNGFIDVGDKASLRVESEGSLTNAADGVIMIAEKGTLVIEGSALNNSGIIDAHPEASVDGNVTGTPVVSNYAVFNASAGEGGAISPSGKVYAHEGENMMFTITPDNGYLVLDVTVDGKSVGKVDSYTFESVKTGEEHDIAVTFEAEKTNQSSTEGSSENTGDLGNNVTDKDKPGDNAADKDKEPGTGDDINIAIPLTAAGLALAAMAAAVATRRRHS